MSGVSLSLFRRYCLASGVGAVAFLASVLNAQAPARTPGELTDAPSRLVRVVSRTTPHLEVTAGLSEDLVEAGRPLSIVLDITPKKDMHVYAPGQEYRPVAVVLQPSPLFRVHDTVYPTPTPYVFGPLKEEVLVYSAPFRLTLDVTAGDTDRQRSQLRSRSQVVIKGTLEYQACDDTVCYLPASVTFEWTVRVKR